MQNLSPMSIISDFKKLAKKLNMAEIHAEIHCWDGGSEGVIITMYSEEKEGNGSKFSIRADLDASLYNVQLLTLKLEADLLEQQLKKAT